MYIEVNSNKKWKRSIDGWLGGVCEGLGNSFNIEPNLIRILWVLSIFIFGTGLAIYLILALTLPREDQVMSYHEDKIFGVCKRIAELTGLELGVVRVLAVVSFFASAGTSVLLYIILHFVLPKPLKKIII